MRGACTVRGARHRWLFTGGALVASLACRTGQPAGGAVRAAAPSPAQCRAAQQNASLPATVYPLSQTDQPAAPVRDNPTPQWPSMIGPTRQEAVVNLEKVFAQGEVQLRYVVDSRGCTVPGSARVVASTDSLFTAEVLRVLPRLRYTPALRGGQPVATELVWKFLFYPRSGATPP